MEPLLILKVERPARSASKGCAPRPSVGPMDPVGSSFRVDRGHRGRSVQLVRLPGGAKACGTSLAFPLRVEVEFTFKEVIVNKDIAAGKWEQMKGAVKEQWG